MSISSIFTPFSEQELMPKEEKLEVVRKEKRFSIGIPKETSLHERRICITPDAVQVLVDHGHEIFIEKNAGSGSFYTDLQFADAGAKICETPEEVFIQDLILKINPPELAEIDMMKHSAFLVSALQINLRSSEYFKKLAEKKINAIGFEFIIDKYKQRSLVRLIGEIAGNISILYAAELLALSTGTMMGGITGVRPTEVVVIGAGIVGEFATKAAVGLGASVRVYDNSLSKLRRLNTLLDGRVPTSILDPKELKKNLRRADVVIGALPRMSMEPIITEEMVLKMKKGAILIDISIDHGKVAETSELTDLDSPFFVKHHVVHCGLPNITSKMPRTTTKAISNFFLSYLLNHDKDGGLDKILHHDNSFKESLYMYKGRHTKKLICERYQLPYHDINLLIF